MNDLKFAFRQLAKSPGFTVIAVLVLALGIGANTTIFSIINSILIKPLQVRHPEQLVGIYQHDRDNTDSFNQFSYPDFADLRSGKDLAFTDLFAFRFTSVGWQGELTERISASFVSANYFSALGVPPALGRGFLPEEETSETPVAVLTHSFWRRLGADPAIVGRKIKLTRGDATVVGVMPRGFTGAQLLAPAIFFPLGMAPTLSPNPGQAGSRILSQLLAEGLLLALLGGAAGLLASVCATNLLAAFIYSGSGMPADFPKFDLAPDSRVLIVLLFLSGLATLFFALGPAWKLARLEVNSDLKRHAGDDARERPKGGLSARELLAVGQMAFALALLVAAALFSRSAINVAAANPGFEFGSNFYLSLDPTLAGYPKPRVRELTRSSIERLSALPGVESVSAATSIPFGDSWDIRSVQIGGAPPPSSAASTLAEGKELYAIYNVVGSDYFRTLGLPLQRGREFERLEAEVTQSPPVAIISQNLADQLWPGQDPLGRSVQFPSPFRTVMTVVGVVPEIPWQVFNKEIRPQIYVPLGQGFPTSLKLHVRVAPGVNPAKLMTASREEVRRLDPPDSADGSQDTHGFAPRRPDRARRASRLGPLWCIRRVGDVIEFARHLRFESVCHRPAHPRNRHPYGFGRGSARRDGDDPSRKRQACNPGARLGFTTRRGCWKTGRKFPLPCPGDGYPHFQRGSAAAARRDLGCLRHPGSPRGENRSNGGITS